LLFLVSFIFVASPFNMFFSCKVSAAMGLPLLLLLASSAIKYQIKIRNLRSSIGLLICTLISENQGLKKSRSNRRKISSLANLDFFLGKKRVDLYHKPEKNPGDKLKTNSGVQDLKSC
jgi:hypothetical protein